MPKKDSAGILAIRQKANQQRQEDQRAQARRRAFTQGGIIAAIIATVAVIAIFVTTSAHDAQAVNIPSGSALISVGSATEVPLKIGESSVRVGAADAPVSLSIFEDFSCPHCAAYEAEVGDTLVELVESGDLAVEFHPLRIVTTYGNRAGSASTCVAVHAPEDWLTVHAALFAVHDQTSDGWNNRELRDFVREVGVSNSDALECVADGTYSNWIDQNTLAARDSGVSATPTILINGEAAEISDAQTLRATVELLASKAQ